MDHLLIKYERPIHVLLPWKPVPLSYHYHKQLSL
uniref:Uncharacterized protein n=1 Tax=Amphimedon queenslandica TaxID=400682 RepID=A0A1X7TKR2_AMPQE